MDQLVKRRKTLKPFVTGLILPFAATLAFSTAAFSAEAVPRPVTPGDGETAVININDRVTFTGSINIGMLTGESKEKAYSPSTGAKISELTWEIDNVVTADIGISIRATSWMSINGNFLFNITDSAVMDDYDWLTNSSDWSDWSHHDDTELKSATSFDINAEFKVYEVSKNFKLLGIIGFKRDNFEWDAFGGTYIYTNRSFRDTTGSFPDGLQVISYEQTYTTPYIGIGFVAGSDCFSFSGKFTGSTFVSADTEDIHYLRGLRFTSDLSEGTMISLDLEGAYHFTDRLSFTLGFTYLSFDEMKGSETIADVASGASIVIPGDAAGFDHSSSLITLGVKYLF